MMLVPGNCIGKRHTPNVLPMIFAFGSGRLRRLTVALIRVFGSAK
jgi:hypothetical protein